MEVSPRISSETGSEIVSEARIEDLAIAGSVLSKKRRLKRYLYRFIAVSFCALFQVAALNASAFTRPDKNHTPGVLCTSSDPDFDSFAYSAHVAKCTRNIEEDEKIQVAGWYGGIPRSDWPKYEFDHLIPLCAGGSNSPQNLWPQPIDEAKLKDKVEDEVCRGLREGTLTQERAVDKVWAWFNSDGRSSAIPGEKLPVQTESKANSDPDDSIAESFE
jgi:hypothetical protein